MSFDKFLKDFNDDCHLSRDELDLCFTVWQAAIQQQWQDIETAPKDGERFLVYFEEKFIDIVTFNGNDFYDSAGDMFYGVTPIYWQPLPQPPNV